jgi:hypothetical protein
MVNPLFSKITLLESTTYESLPEPIQVGRRSRNDRECDDLRDSIAMVPSNDCFEFRVLLQGCFNEHQAFIFDVDLILPENRSNAI